MRVADPRLRRGIEVRDRVLAPVREPHGVGLVHEDRIDHRARADEAPLAPLLAGGVIHPELARVPFRDPHAALRVAPHATCALTAGRRREHDRPAGLLHDPADVAPRERREVHLAVGARRDAVRAGAAWRVGDRHRTAPRIETPKDAALTREPERAGATSCGPWPRGNGNSSMANSSGRGEVPGGGGTTVAAAVGVTTGGDAGGIVGDGSARVAAGAHAIIAEARTVRASFIATAIRYEGEASSSRR